MGIRQDDDSAVLFNLVLNKVLKQMQLKETFCASQNWHLRMQMIIVLVGRNRHINSLRFKCNSRMLPLNQKSTHVQKLRQALNHQIQLAHGLMDPLRGLRCSVIDSTVAEWVTKSFQGWRKYGGLWSLNIIIIQKVMKEELLDKKLPPVKRTENSETTAFHHGVLPMIKNILI